MHTINSYYRPERVLQNHIMALQTLEAQLPENLDTCMHYILALKGRLVCTGVGKSAFIMHKLASSFASIGIPAYALDASHAVHGDLGALTPEDVLLLGSYGGESTELIPLLSFANLHTIPSILLTAFPEKTLGQRATQTLKLPRVQESGPLRCVPTTSCMLMLAVGDILLGALESRISLEQYRTHHPHGSLGFKLSPVREFMSPPQGIPIVQFDTPITDTLLTISEKRLGCAGVVNASGELIGVISDGDIRRACAQFGNITVFTAQEVMHRAPKTLDPDSRVQDALHIMERYKITFLFIVDTEGKPVGVFHIHDSWNAIR